MTPEEQEAIIRGSDAIGYSGWVQIESAVPKGLAMPAAYQANLNSCAASSHEQ